jgi:hypothetical protein
VRASAVGGLRKEAKANERESERETASVLLDFGAESFEYKAAADKPVWYVLAARACEPS